MTSQRRRKPRSAHDLWEPVPCQSNLMSFPFPSQVRKENQWCEEKWERHRHTGPTCPRSSTGHTGVVHNCGYLDLVYLEPPLPRGFCLINTISSYINLKQEMCLNKIPISQLRPHSKYFPVPSVLATVVFFYDLFSFSFFLNKIAFWKNGEKKGWILFVLSVNSWFGFARTHWVTRFFSLRRQVKGRSE